MIKAGKESKIYLLQENQTNLEYMQLNYLFKVNGKK